MSYVRLSTRLPRIEAGPLALPALDDDWSEIEALLTSPDPSGARRRIKVSSGLGRSIAGIAALIATGGLALAGWSAFGGSCDGNGCRFSRPVFEIAAMAPSTMEVSARTQVVGAPGTVEEGRSVAAGTPEVPRGRPMRNLVGSIDPQTDQPTVEGSAADSGLRHRGGHRHKHRESRAGLVDRHASR